LGQLVAKMGLVDVARGFRVLVDRGGGRAATSARRDLGSRWR
jgi:hypothetical protein